MELLKATGEHPEAAIDKVTTPGGLTIRGLNEMEHAGFSSAVIRGMKAGKPQTHRDQAKPLAGTVKGKTTDEYHTKVTFQKLI